MSPQMQSLMLQQYSTTASVLFEKQAKRKQLFVDHVNECSNAITDVTGVQHYSQPAVRKPGGTYTAVV